MHLTYLKQSKANQALSMSKTKNDTKKLTAKVPINHLKASKIGVYKGIKQQTTQFRAKALQANKAQEVKRNPELKTNTEL
jgi:hypothetical protein